MLHILVRIKVSGEDFAFGFQVRVCVSNYASGLIFQGSGFKLGFRITVIDFESGFETGLWFEIRWRKVDHLRYHHHHPWWTVQTCQAGPPELGRPLSWRSPPLPSLNPRPPSPPPPTTITTSWVINQCPHAPMLMHSLAGAHASPAIASTVRGEHKVNVISVPVGNLAAPPPPPKDF